MGGQSGAKGREGAGAVVGDNVVVKIGLGWGKSEDPGQSGAKGWFGVMKILDSGVTGDQKWCRRVLVAGGGRLA